MFPPFVGGLRRQPQREKPRLWTDLECNSADAAQDSILFLGTPVEEILPQREIWLAPQVALAERRENSDLLDTMRSQV